MKKHTRKWLVPALLGVLALLIAALFCLPREDLPGWEPPEGLSRAQARTVKREILNVVKEYPAPSGGEFDRAALDKLEDQLIHLGWPVEDSDPVYPSYLANAEGLETFWQRFSAGEKADTSFLRITEDGGFSLTHFFQERGEPRCVLVSVGWDGDRPQVRLQENLPVYDMALADWQTFYYRLYPEDPHYIDYMQVRLTPPDREMYDLCRKYILPVGYQMVNLFLVDWEEGAWGELSFPDVFEYLYAPKDGQSGFDWTDYVDPENRKRAIIPTEMFEETLLSYFRISREELRTAASWGEKGYPWRTFFGDDVTSRSYPFCEPAVTEVTENGDGTFTLHVRVGSPEKKTDCLFCHAVTIRPLPDGGFQYVSNRVTEVGQWGLPYRQSRFELDE